VWFLETIWDRINVEIDRPAGPREEGSSRKQSGGLRGVAMCVFYRLVDTCSRYCQHSAGDDADESGVWSGVCTQERAAPGMGLAAPFRRKSERHVLISLVLAQVGSGWKLHEVLLFISCIVVHFSC
jgi:hypothetical protein